MKWFKHDSTAMYNALIEDLMFEYGIEGYGVFFACLELIAHTVKKDNLSFELEHNTKVLANKFKIEISRLEEILDYCVKTKLFEKNEEGKITCVKLAKRIDDSMAKNPQIKEIQQKIVDSGLFGKSPKDSE